ncbi:DsbA family protein [Aquipseudomonas alcaligenes]|uniref:DsbA family protein n=1 Tax=Aquipseudomonas alcaligenes TaxID=43263 RepID=UPI0035B35F9A
MAVIHYWYDPLCGWCYGAAPLLQVAGEIPGLRIALHGGGLFSGAQRQRLNAPLRQHILAHDQRIAALSGQPFGAAYRDGLLQDAETWLDSDPPTAAVLAAEALAGQGLAMLHALQQAHYQQGRRIAEPAVLAELAQELGLAAQAFRAELQRHNGPVLAEHLVASRRALAQLGGGGFPTLALERDGQLQVLDIGAYLGRPEAWREFLRRGLVETPPATGRAFCAVDGSGDC